MRRTPDVATIHHRAAGADIDLARAYELVIALKRMIHGPEFAVCNAILNEAADILLRRLRVPRASPPQ